MYICTYQYVCVGAHSIQLNNVMFPFLLQITSLHNWVYPGCGTVLQSEHHSPQQVSCSGEALVRQLQSEKGVA